MVKKILKPIYIFIKKIIIALKSCYFSKKINRGKGKIVFSHWNNKLIIRKNKNSILQIDGILKIEKFHHFSNPVIISIAEGGSLIIENDFILGEGIKITVCKDATLKIKGKKIENASGITANSVLMVKKFLSIGYDFLCSWNVFITDCDWHYVGGEMRQIDTVIGNHVWVTCNCSILKGSVIGSNSILSNGTVIHREKFDNFSLISGNPAHRVKKASDWSR